MSQKNGREKTIDQSINKKSSTDRANPTCLQNFIKTMYWFGVESRMIFMCSITSLNGARSFMRSWLVMVAGTVRMHTIALRLTSSVSDVILLHRNSENQKAERHRDKSKPVRGLLGLIQMHNTMDDLH